MKPYLSTDGRFHKRRPLRRYTGSSARLYVAPAGADPAWSEIGGVTGLSIEFTPDADEPSASVDFSREFSCAFRITRVGTAPIAGSTTRLPLLDMPQGDVGQN